MVTQHDIAQKLGISRTLVSRALSGTADRIGAAAETVRLIQETAAAMGYRPDAAARTLRGASSRTIGVVIKDFEDPFFGHMIGVLQRLSRETDYTLLLAGADTSHPDQRFAIDVDALLKYRLDGVLIGGSDLDPVCLQPLHQKQLPLVQIATSERLPRTGRVTVDQEYGFRVLVKYLCGLGHRNIGFIGDTSPSHQRRASLLRSVLTANGVQLRDNWFQAAPGHDRNAGFLAMTSLLSSCRHERPTAIIAADDDTAHSALRAVYEHRMRVPENLSLTGMDDVPAAGMMIPGLTTVRQPVADMVRAAFMMLTAAAGVPGNRRNLSDIVLKPELVVRESCAVAPRGQWLKLDRRNDGNAPATP